MNKKNKHISINTLPSGTRDRVVIAQNTFNGLPNAKEIERPHFLLP